MSRRSNSRRIQPGALVAGLVFLAIATGYGLDAAGRWHLWPPLALLAATVGLSFAGLAAALSRTTRRGLSERRRGRNERWGERLGGGR